MLVTERSLVIRLKPAMKTVMRKLWTTANGTVLLFKVAMTTQNICKKATSLKANGMTQKKRVLTASLMTLKTGACKISPEVKGITHMFVMLVTGVRETSRETRALLIANAIDLIPVGLMLKGNELTNLVSDGVNLKISNHGIERERRIVPEIREEDTTVVIVPKITQDEGLEVDVEDLDRDLVDPDHVDQIGRRNSSLETSHSTLMSTRWTGFFQSTVVWQMFIFPDRTKEKRLVGDRVREAKGMPL